MEREEEPRFHHRNLQQDVDEVTKIVQENSQDIKIAGNVGGKGAIKSGGVFPDVCSHSFWNNFRLISRTRSQSAGLNRLW